MHDHSVRARLCILPELIRQDLRLRYAASFLGAAWSILLPLVTLLVFWFVFALGFRNPPVRDVPYLLWFAAGYVPWLGFQEAVSQGVGTLRDYSFLIRKIPFPVGLLPVVRLLSSGLLHLFFIFILFLLMILYGFPVHPDVFLFCYYEAALLSLEAGLVFLLSAVAVRVPDIASAAGILLQVGFWVTPVLWDYEGITDPGIRLLLSLNPMEYIVQGCRSCLFSDLAVCPDPLKTLWFWSLTGLLFFGGILVFEEGRRTFADEL